MLQTHTQAKKYNLNKLLEIILGGTNFESM